MTDEDHARLAAEYAALEREITELDAAMQAREDAKARVTELSRDIGARLARVGHFAELAGEPFDNEVARRLYWQYPDIHVSEIAHPMRMREALVNKHVGDGSFEAPCASGCGATAKWVLRSRTETRRRDYRFCEECRARLERERRAYYAERRETYEREHEENVRLLRQAMANGGAHVRYAEFPGVGGTWQVDENGVPLAIKDE